MSKSTGKRKPWKVAGHIIPRPFSTFPLSPHASGSWMKRIRGRIHYFGRWANRVNGQLVRIEGDGWEAALGKYKSVADDIHAGRKPQAKPAEGLTILGLVNLFLTAKFHQWQAGELSGRMFSQVPGQDPKGEYPTTCELLLAAFGKTRLVLDLDVDDFQKLRADLAKRYGPTRLGNVIQMMRTIFKFAYDSRKIDKPVFFGTAFKKPSKTVMRRHRAQKGKRLFSPEELHRLIDAANSQLRAMIYLGANAAYGNSDCAQLPMEALDLAAGWATYPRPKTGLERRAKLWPETVAAIQEALAARPEPKDAAHAQLVFITKYGQPWESKGFATAVSHEFKKLLTALGIARPGLGFYSLRHTFRTIADGAHDLAAIRLVMGHGDESIDSIYRETIDDSRLETIANHVHQWLFPPEKPAADEGEPSNILPMPSRTA